MTDMGVELYSAGAVNKRTFHASLYAELESLASGLGDDLELLFGMIWASITDDEVYAGGTGGIYGSIPSKKNNRAQQKELFTDTE